MQARARARLVALRVTEEALERYPDHTVAAVRAALERSARRRTSERLEARVILLGLTIRAMDTHPAVARSLVRLWLRRAGTTLARTSQRQQQRAATD